jgi:thiamine kinase-like enzyme
LLGEGIIDGYRYLIQEAVSGKRLKKTDGRKTKQVLTLILELHKLFGIGEREINDVFLARYINEPIQKFLDFYGFRGTRLENACRLVAGEFKKQKGQKIPLIWQHGDFHFANIFIDGEKMKLLDWENFGEIELPMYDLFTFLSSRAGAELSADEFVRKFKKELENYATTFSVDRSLFEPFYKMHVILNYVKKIPLYESNDYRILGSEEIII